MFKRLIGFRSRPTGRFGNHIFQYYFLHKIANQLESETFHTKFLGSKIFKGFESKWINNTKYMMRPGHSLSYQSYSEMNWNEFINVLSEIQRNNKVVSLPTGRLDWFFYDNQPEDISEIIKFRYELDAKKDSHIKKIAIHFRAGDFVSLRPDWILPQAYYEKSIEYLTHSEPLVDTRMVLYTDDPSHPTVGNLLNKYKITLNEDRNYLDAFKEIISSDVLISSNSTFSYWGGVLGRKKKVILSKDWINKEIDLGDKFWLPVRENRCKFLRDIVEI